MAPSPYIHERQTEYWTSRGVEKYFEGKGFDVRVFPITQLTEKKLPTDFLFFDRHLTKIFGFQYKPLYKNSFDHWRIDQEQHKELLNFPWIYYSLSELRYGKDYDKALDLSLVVRSDQLAAEVQPALDVKNRCKYWRWDSFHDALQQCKAGAKVENEEGLHRLIFPNFQTSQPRELAVNMSDVFLADFTRGCVLHFSPWNEIKEKKIMNELHSGFHWGPTNPHPLSKMRTELVWDGKYDEYGNRREVDIAACAMPMQKIETVDEPRQRAAAEGNLELFEKELGGKKRDDFRNRLIWGDNKLVLASLLKEFKGRIDLIYIDPPFDVGADFTMDVPIGDGKETVGKDQSTLEMIAYRDMWGKGTDSYLHMMFERLTLMKELLSEKGSILVHCDWRVNAYLRIIMDEIFGRGAAADGGAGFRNQIAFCYSGGGIPQKEMPRKYDSILWFTIGKDWTFNPVYRAYSQGTIERGRTAVKGPNAELRAEGTPVNDWWPDVKKITSPTDPEKLGYDTQKSEDLLARIITMFSNEGDLVADFFCGSGTSGAVAEGLDRRWIMSDLGRFAIHTSRKRLIDLQRKLHKEGQPYRAFDVYNLGRYERQWWQKDRLKGAEEEHRRIVLEFFKAEILNNPPNPLLHGRKAGAFCHVDGIDGIFTRNDARLVADATIHSGGREVYCLAWEFEMELRQYCIALEAELGVMMKLVPIPREIMEKNRKSPPPFLEMAVLEAAPVFRTEGRKKTVDIKLTKFLPSLAEVPSNELEALKARVVKSGFDFIDFWAVDFDWNPGESFNHHWQDYRTRKDRALKTVSDAGYSFEKAGKHTICVKVVDVFGCDTSITVEVTI